MIFGRRVEKSRAASPAGLFAVLVYNCLSAVKTYLVKLNNFLVFFLIIAFVAMGGFGFAHAFYASHQHGCPFLPNSFSFCAMDVWDHIRSWQNLFLSVLPVVFILFLAPSDFFLGKILKDFNFFVFLKWIWRDKEPNLFQYLFAKGILNPKKP